MKRDANHNQKAMPSYCSVTIQRASAPLESENLTSSSIALPLFNATFDVIQFTMETGQPSSSDLFLDVPFSKRWESHKNTICKLYIDEDLSIEDVANRMKRQYRFDAK
jgi:hypothetical protein